MSISTQDILQHTNNGLDFYKFVIPDLLQQGNKCKNTKNPFYNDTKPSLSIFFKSGQWLFRDHGSPDFTGDVFTFAAHYYNLSIKSDFNTIVNNMNNDLNLNISEPPDKKEYSQVEKQLYYIKQTNKKEAVEYQKSRGLTKQQHFYQSKAYKKYPASVVFVNHNETGFERRNIASEQELQEKDLPKTQYFGIKENTLFVSGYNSKNDTVFICEGPNNALSFVEIGHSAIATFGAGNLPTPDLLRKYIENKTVILAGDGDDAGDNFNTQLALLILENKISVTDLQAIYFPDGKDANDLLLSNELTNYNNVCQIADFDKIKETFQQYIEEQEKQQPELSTLPTLPTSYNEQTEQENETNEPEEDRIFNTEFLPESIYKNLPEILTECTNLFQDSIEKDVFLIGAIGVLSACLPNIEGTYFESEYSAHLFVFITAPAGSGKGNLKWAKFFGQIIHDKMVEQSEKDRAEYEQELENYNNLKRNEKAEQEKPEEPPFKVFYIPGNSSSASFMNSLQANQFTGIIFETEADTIAQTFKNDWGSYSDILRKAFHHENTGLMRKDRYIEIKEPRLAVVLSGTPEQVHNLMPSTENGLFSRFLYYAFEDEGEFKNPFEKRTGHNFKDYFTEKGNEIFELFNHLNSLKKPINFQVTKEQADHFTKTFRAMLKRNNFLVGRDFSANVKRLGVITFRIAMILSALRIPEEGDISSPVICSDTDYNTAMTIVLCLERHAVEVFKNQPNHNLKGDKLKFFDTLPNEFDRKTYLKVGAETGVKEKAADKYIGQFKKLNLLKHEYNQYTKIKM